jgi:transcriptional regulator with PAS, ATPase and Fis domain
MALGVESPPVDRHASAHIHYENGQERFAVLTTTPILDAEGNAAGAVAVLRSVSERTVPAKRYEVVAESPRTRELMQFVRRVAASEAGTILLEGENGTGKDLLARTIHHHSTRQAGPFIAINCAAVPETLIESELFGYERGAFTDARQQKRGLFELADKGTLFLDEIGEIPMVLQVKLLRALEERTFRRLGGLKDIEIDVRLVAATNRNLREAVREGAFRQDLYFRLNVIHVDIPPLRERREDILPMAKFFIDQYNRKFKRHIEGITSQAERALLAHDWPGNVRELRNAIERAMILEEAQLITLGTLPIPPARETPIIDAPSTVMPENGLSLEEHERQLLEQALARTNGNQTQAARLLSITRDTLRYKIKKFGLRH